jgi:hypothetical protein
VHENVVCVQDGMHAVNTALEEVKGPRSRHVVTDRLVLNHYVTKSLEQFQAKMARGSGMGDRKSMAFFRMVQSHALQNCSHALHLG